MNIYISIPYVDDELTRKWQHVQYMNYADELINQGNTVVPHIISTTIEAVHIIMFNNWKQSEQVKREIAIANLFNLPIEYVESTWVYTTPDYLEMLKTTNPESLLIKIDYILWESSTNYIIDSGLPSDRQVRLWIDVLKSREDREKVQIIIDSCLKYINDD